MTKEKRMTMKLYTDLAAARLEGLAPMPDDLIALRNEKLALAKTIESAKAREEEIKQIFRDRLKEESLVGFILFGKVKARLKAGTRTGLDTKRLREEMKHVYDTYVTTTSYDSMTIN